MKQLKTIAGNFILITGLMISSMAFGQETKDQQTGQEKKKKEDKSSSHVMTTPDQLKWGPGPKHLPAGAEVVVMDGDPSKSGPYTLRLKMPAGYKVMPHWHPADEHVTVLEGTISMGMGDKFEEGKLKEFSVGSYIKAPAKTNHFATAKTNAVIQLHGMGPFQITYVNPADDPSKATK